MNTLRHIRLLALATITTLLTAACSTDAGDQDITPDGNEGQMVKVHLRVQPQGNTTRAWNDTNAEDAEMMNIWTVVIVENSSSDVKEVIACKPTGSSREIDADITLPQGTEYRFYSFANISPDNVKTLLNTKAGTTIAFTLDESAMTDDVQTAATGVSGNLTADQANAVVATLNGNLLDPTAANDFSETGIPMSNVQTMTIPTTGVVQLVVVRMVAKLTFEVKNETGAAARIRYATISSITQNEADNIMLLPKFTSTGGPNEMTVTQHGDLQPNLNGTPSTKELEIADLMLTAELANGDTRTASVYVNECKKGSQFYITIGLGDDSDVKEYRYALVSNQNEQWDYIARNDWRTLPIVLDDYHFSIIPYDFPPIGVLPVSVSEIDATNHIYQFTFHDYGHFHLLPQVTKGSSTPTTVEFWDGEGTAPSGDYWMLQAGANLNVQWDATWSTYAAYGDATQTENPGTFYRTTGATDIDADEAGSVPVWYPNTTGKPQWDPAASGTYRPFIFGYIDDPGTLSADKLVYHEMKIRLFVGGAYRRDIIYRFYMRLPKDGMMLAPRKGVQRRSHGL